MEYFLSELYGEDVNDALCGTDSKAKDDKSGLSLKEKNHNLPEICIEIDM